MGNSMLTHSGGVSVFRFVGFIFYIIILLLWNLREAECWLIQVDRTPRLSIRIVILILPSDTGDDMYCICFDDPNRETEMLSAIRWSFKPQISKPHQPKQLSHKNISAEMYLSSDFAAWRQLNCLLRKRRIVWAPANFELDPSILQLNSGSCLLCILEPGYSPT